MKLLETLSMATRLRAAQWLAAGVTASLAASLIALPARSLAASSDSSRTAGTPEEREYSYVYDIFDNSFVRPATRAFDLALLVRKATGHPREAANVDADDQVRLPSTWWQPRAGFRPVTPQQMLHGPGPGTGPAPGRWVVSHAKDQGVTVGFQIKDSAGQKFLVKFDPPGYPDLGTACDAIGSRLFWAAGYNVPDNSIATFRLSDLDIGKDAMFTDSRGRKRPMTAAYLEQLLTKVAAPV